MELASRREGPVRIVTVWGRIDQSTSEDFQQALSPYLIDCTTLGTPLLLDFSGIDYISSVGLRTLVLAARIVKAKNGKIAIAALTPIVAEMFQISRFNLIFQVYDSIGEAISELTK